MLSTGQIWRQNQKKKDFNACHDLFKVVTQCHIIIAAMTFLNMENFEDKPQSDLVPDPAAVLIVSCSQTFTLRRRESGKMGFIYISQS